MLEATGNDVTILIAVYLMIVIATIAVQHIIFGPPGKSRTGWVMYNLPPEIPHELFFERLNEAAARRNVYVHTIIKDDVRAGRAYLCGAEQNCDSIKSDLEAQGHAIFLKPI